MSGSPKPTVMVSGASGYLASWLVKTLLDQGYRVRATVRNPKDEDKVGHLQAMAAEAPGKLELFAADLMKSGSFDEAMAGCSIVFHTASPFIAGTVDDPQASLIQPALQGTQNVLASANRTDSVTRVVLTSSVVAIMGDNRDIDQTENACFDENCWNTTSSEAHNPYNYAKTLAEQSAWTLAGQQDRWALVVINPGFILGPSLTPRVDSTSIATIKDMIEGKYSTGVPQLFNGIVDVRGCGRSPFESRLFRIGQRQAHLGQ